MPKQYLLTPGPTPVPERAALKMAEPIIHHRTPEFEAVLAKVREQLRWLFQTKEEVIMFASSGTGAMEASVSNLLSSGDKALVIKGGKFGERWSEILKAYKIETIEIPVEWAKPWIGKKWKRPWPPTRKPGRSTSRLLKPPPGSSIRSGSSRP